MTIRIDTVMERGEFVHRQTQKKGKRMERVLMKIAKCE